jgi:hypothetical protein
MGKINMKKQWLIKINGENDLYYDSEKKIYILRLFCTYCGKPSDCQCYENYEDYEYDRSSQFPVRCCSYLCCLRSSHDEETENIKEAVQSLGMSTKSLEEYTEEEAEQIIDYIVDKFMWDIDDDSAGEQCGI